MDQKKATLRCEHAASFGVKSASFVFSNAHMNPALTYCEPQYHQQDQPSVARTSDVELPEILIIDDERLVREVNRRILERAGFQVACAENEQIALDIYRHKQSSIKLLIIDLFLSESNGRDLYDKLDLKSHPIKTIFTSGVGETAIISDIIDRRKNYFLEKPYPPKHLIDLIHTMLE